MSRRNKARSWLLGTAAVILLGAVAFQWWRAPMSSAALEDSIADEVIATLALNTSISRISRQDIQLSSLKLQTSDGETRVTGDIAVRRLPFVLAADGKKYAFTPDGWYRSTFRATCVQGFNVTRSVSAARPAWVARQAEILPSANDMWTGTRAADFWKSNPSPNPNLLFDASVDRARFGIGATEEAVMWLMLARSLRLQGKPAEARRLLDFAHRDAQGRWPGPWKQRAAEEERLLKQDQES